MMENLKHLVLKSKTETDGRENETSQIYDKIPKCLNWHVLCIDGIVTVEPRTHEKKKKKLYEPVYRA